MRIMYDEKNDIISMYFEEDEITAGNDGNNKMTEPSGAEIDREYEMDEAATLILDMVDIHDSEENVIGFRVFNASKHYSKELLSYADLEELSEEVVTSRQQEKVIAKITAEGKMSAAAL